MEGEIGPIGRSPFGPLGLSIICCSWSSILLLSKFNSFSVSAAEFLASGAGVWYPAYEYNVLKNDCSNLKSGSVKLDICDDVSDRRQKKTPGDLIYI